MNAPFASRRRVFFSGRGCAGAGLTDGGRVCYTLGVHGKWFLTVGPQYFILSFCR